MFGNYNGECDEQLQNQEKLIHARWGKGYSIFLAPIPRVINELVLATTTINHPKNWNTPSDVLLGVLYRFWSMLQGVPVFFVKTCWVWAHFWISDTFGQLRHFWTLLRIFGPLCTQGTLSTSGHSRHFWAFLGSIEHFWTFLGTLGKIFTLVYMKNSLFKIPKK